MKKIYVLPFILITIVSLSACGSGSLQTPTETLVPTQTISPATNTPAPTETATQPIIETATAGSPGSTSSVSFANDVAPILNNSCIKCHGVEQVKEGLDLRSYETLMAGSFNGPVIKPGDSANSLLIEQLINGEMPKRGAKLTPEQIQIISDWVIQGAGNN